ncbi:MAG: hypothetical protein F4174_06145 [Acidobacteria bacterium]|nr:hypothetical protein [Acidobacteriota bacterium]
MTGWSLHHVLSGLDTEVNARLQRARESIRHSGTKGDASENVWLALFADYLPARYHARKAHVVDSKGRISDQIDVVVFDRQYSPFIFSFEAQIFVPAESVYAVFETKQTVTSGYVEYAQKKTASVRRLHRTSLPIPHAGGEYPAKVPFPILGGILSLESEWKPPMGRSLRRALETSCAGGQLDLGCVAAHGHFHFDKDQDGYNVFDGGRPVTAFLFDLLSHLQSRATVPMIDIHAYGRWLEKRS